MVARQEQQRTAEQLRAEREALLEAREGAGMGLAQEVQHLQAKMAAKEAEASMVQVRNARARKRSCGQSHAERVVGRQQQASLH